MLIQALRNQINKQGVVVLNCIVETIVTIAVEHVEVATLRQQVLKLAEFFLAKSAVASVGKAAGIHQNRRLVLDLFFGLRFRILRDSNLHQLSLCRGNLERELEVQVGSSVKDYSENVDVWEHVEKRGMEVDQAIRSLVFDAVK